MANIRDIKKRIKSVTNTKKVTHAMELVAAAKMRKSQMAALSARPYSISLHEVLAYIERNPTLTHPLLRQNETNTNTAQMVLIITSDRGLAGGLNTNLFREAAKNDLKNVKYVAVGKKAINFVAKTNEEMTATFGSEEIPVLDLARLLTKMSIDAYTNKEVSKVAALYPDFESTVTQTPRLVQILPIEMSPEDSKEEKDLPTENVLFEPNAQQILDEILPHHVLTTIYQILLEAKASEHSARMVAMKNATDAADDLIDDLTLTYNQARQEAITKELLDIVTAQRAFK